MRRRLPSIEQWTRLVKAATKLVRPVEPPLRRPPGGWIIELHPDEDEDLVPGHFRTHVRAGAACRGARTRRRSDASSPAGERGGRDTPDESGTRDLTAGGRRVGELTYRDNLGREHTARLDRDEIRVGRGGRDALVDVTIEGPEDVSRVHAVIRRDRRAACDLKDVSRFGTTIDNDRVPPSLDGAGRDADRWVPVRRTRRSDSRALSWSISVRWPSHESPRWLHLALVAGIALFTGLVAWLTRLDRP